MIMTLGLNTLKFGVESQTGFEIPPPLPEITSKVSQLKSRMAENQSESRARKSSVVILGGGTAGLMRALVSLVNGNPTQVIEKRAADLKARDNIVTLLEESFDLLDDYGILEYLHQNQLIKKNIYRRPFNTYPSIDVRICDLELAIKMIINQLDPHAISYSSEVESHELKEGHDISLKIRSIIKTDEIKSRIENCVDVLVISEGSKSVSNKRILNNRYIRYLKPIPTVLVNFTMPGENDIFSPISYFLRGLWFLVSKITSLCLNRFRQPQQVGAFTQFKIPNQCDSSASLSNTEIKEINRLKSKMIQAEGSELEAQAKKDFEDYLVHKARIAGAAHSIVTFVTAIQRGDMGLLNTIPSWHAKAQVKIFDATLRKAETLAKVLGNTLCLVAGDAAVTADSVTSLGCTTAISTAKQFLRSLKARDSGTSLSEIVDDYVQRTSEDVQRVVQRSLDIRRLVNPDAILENPILET